MEINVESLKRKLTDSEKLSCIKNQLEKTLHNLKPDRCTPQPSCYTEYYKWDNRDRKIWLYTNGKEHEYLRITTDHTHILIHASSLECVKTLVDTHVTPSTIKFIKTFVKLFQESNNA